MDLDSTVAQLTERLRPNSGNERLATLYQWPVGDLDALRPHISDSRWIEEIKAAELKNVRNILKLRFENTLKLRDNIRRELELCDLNDQGRSRGIAKWIIRDWGGIGSRVKDDKLEARLTNAENATQSQEDFDVDGIASWSKYLAFKYPTEHAIYDARVIYSLNWLLYRTATHKGALYYPMPPSRNTVLGLLDYQILLLFDCNRNAVIADCLSKDIKSRSPGGKSSFSRNIGETTFLQDGIYLKYCTLLRQIADQLYGREDCHGLTKVEMILFSQADREIASEVVEFYANVHHRLSN